MNNKLYNTIFKRKSFHLFKNIGNERLTEAELAEIEALYPSLTPLYPGIRTEMKTIPAGILSKFRGEEYCLLLYSEKKENYLANIGYIGEQLDLELTSRGIGTLWYGIGKPEEKTYNGLDYVIMFLISKADSENKFRKDMFKAKRKDISDIWAGEMLDGVTDISRFAPSACNSQPWLTERKGDTLTVYRCKKPGKVGIMSASAVDYYNRIDMGIYMCFLELCLAHEDIAFERAVFADNGGEKEKTKFAEYKISKTS